LSRTAERLQGEESTHVVAPRDRRASLGPCLPFPSFGCRAVWSTVPRGRNGQRVLPSLERDPQGLPDGDGWRLADPAAHHPSSGQPGLADEAQALSLLGVRWTEPAAPAQPQFKHAPSSPHHLIWSDPGRCGLPEGVADEARRTLVRVKGPSWLRVRNLVEGSFSIRPCRQGPEPCRSR
jgi:hypothetical protein